MPTELPGGLVTLLGLLAPVLIQLATKYVKNELLRFVVALVLSGLTGIAAMAWAGVAWAVTPTFLALWFTFSSISWKLFWKPLYKLALGVETPPTKI